MFCSLIANSLLRGGFRTAATSKMELFVIIVNGWKPLTIITKSSTLDGAAVLDPPLIMSRYCSMKNCATVHNHCATTIFIDSSQLLIHFDVII